MKKQLIVTSVSGILFLLLLAMVRSFDVAAIGPNGTEIGFAAMNGAVRDAVGFNLFWYDLTEIFGVLGLGVCAIFGLMGLMQLIKGRSLAKVDPDILALGVLYVLVIGLYVVFEVVVINRRPVIMPGETAVEASFPSSHTMLICCVMGSAAMVLKGYVHRPELRMGLQGGCAVIAAVTVAGRLLSGVHWLTDIVGAVLLSIALLGVFSAVRVVIGKFFAKGAHEQTEGETE